MQQGLQHNQLEEGADAYLTGAHLRDFVLNENYVIYHYIPVYMYF